MLKAFAIALVMSSAQPAVTTDAEGAKAPTVSKSIVVVEKPMVKNVALETHVSNKLADKDEIHSRNEIFEREALPLFFYAYKKISTRYAAIRLTEPKPTERRQATCFEILNIGHAAGPITKPASRPRIW